MRIGSLAQAGGTTAKTVRFYEQERLLPPPARTASGYRDYPPDAADRLVFIRDAQAAGLSLAEIRDVLAIRDAGQAPCAHVSSLIAEHLRHIEQRIAELEQTRAALRTLAQKAAATGEEGCEDGAICRILSDR